MSLLSILARYWFPLALVALCILATPGLLLLALHLAGADGPVNEWLEDHFQLSYHLAVPWLLALLLLLVIPAIVLLYFLKLKRKPLQVPSTFLWRKSIEDLHVNSLFQWLRENILLILQILAVLVLIYAVLGFRFHGNTSRGRHYILLIDNSASMAATDQTPSRLHWAKQEALKEIDAAGDEDSGMVIVFNSKATTLQAYTNNRARLRQAVQSIEQTPRPTRIEEALNLADSLANPVRSTEDTSVRPEGEVPGQERTYVAPKGIATSVHLFSDGRFAGLSDAALAGLNSRLAGNSSILGNLNLKYHMAGADAPENTDNLGVVALNVLRLPTAGDMGGADLQNLRVLARVRNYRREAADVKLRLDVIVKGRIIHPEQRSVTIRGRTSTREEGSEELVDEPGEATLTFDLPPLDLRINTVVHAYLDRNKDALRLDDEAWLVIGTVRKAKVLRVGGANPVLDAFFDQEATRRVASVERLAAADLDGAAYRTPASSGQVDLVIFDRCAPAEEKDLPQANAFFIDCPPPPWKRSKTPLVNPYLVIAKREQPILRHLSSLWDVGVSDAFRFDIKADLDEAVRADFQRPDVDPRKRTLPPLTRLIEAGNEVPLLFALPRGPHTDLVMTFPLVNDKQDLTTNWPLQPSFPLFMRNVLYELGNVRDAVREDTVQPGEPMVLRPEAGVNWLQITAPSGHGTKLERSRNAEFAFAATDELGTYRVQRDDGGERSFAVNLLDGAESNIEPRREIQIGSERFAAGEERQQPLELWKWIILLALLLLMVEWYIYNRRVYI